MQLTFPIFHFKNIFKHFRFTKLSNSALNYNKQTVHIKNKQFVMAFAGESYINHLLERFIKNQDYAVWSMPNTREADVEKISRKILGIMYLAKMLELFMVFVP